MAKAANISPYRPDGNIRSMDNVRRDMIRLALTHYGNDVNKAAAWLGVSKSLVYREAKGGELGEYRRRKLKEQYDASFARD